MSEARAVLEGSDTPLQRVERRTLRFAGTFELSVLVGVFSGDRGDGGEVLRHEAHGLHT
jgi:hypothetical protein